MYLFIVFFIVLFYCILTHSELSMFYALNGLNLWFQRMIPALLPFMILSSTLIRMNLSEKVVLIFKPLFQPIFRIRLSVIYGLIVGFLFGFPMGAQVTAQLYNQKKITKNEADYLLCFCNNIGPVYFMSFALPLLNTKHNLPYLFGMYGIPLLYGLCLRYTYFRNKFSSSYLYRIDSDSHIDSFGYKNILYHLEYSITKSLQNIAILGGYMILFNLLCLPFHILFGRIPYEIAPFLEISGGLSLLKDKYPIYSLCLLVFGGCSCICQTYSCIKGTDLKLSHYILHKLLLTFIVLIYFLLLRFLCLL